ncbi:ribokinase [Brevibacillus choshinensis]|uniref:ribokinase n=2 Tax=Brevibacillus choshinensis TaxID=54911 RepID=UPI002E24E35C|nr:ribokinase [Brevibacillus choshinensis]MED4582699.1 ribokinase [Brevibacillus choshinensis]MED4587102.1 ribokinase [Brevibacillus choshinensis]
MDIAVIGSNMVDLVSYIDKIPNEGETLEAADFKIGCGGKGANQAVAAAKMGSKVMMVTKVGDDLFADRTIENLESYGIDTEFTSKIPGTSSGVAPIFVDRESKNRILIIKGANQYLLPEDIDHAAKKLKKSSLIVLQLEIPIQTTYRAIEFGKENGIPIILNPAPAAKKLDFDYVSKCDYFIPNESELELLTGMPVESKDQIRTAASTLIEKGLKNVIVTMGSRGVMWVKSEKIFTIDSYKVDAIDTTGAGDAFIGCFAHFLVQSGDVLLAIKMATAFAALSVVKQGTQTSYPSVQELEQFIKTQS